MKFTVVFIVLSMVFTVAFAQSKRVNINDDATGIGTLKSAERLMDFDIATKQARSFSINPQFRDPQYLIAGDTIQLDLFPGESYLSVIASKIVDINQTLVFEARLIDYRFAHCFILVNGSEVLVTIEIPELKEYFATRLNPKDGKLCLLQLDENDLDILPGGEMPDKNDEPVNQSPGIKSSQVDYSYDIKKSVAGESPKSSVADLGAEDPAKIDVLAVYTPMAKDWVTSHQGNINNTISQAIANCNLVSANSNLGITFNLVYSAEVEYVETGNSSTDLRNLTDGLISNVHAIRDASSADLVVLFSNTEDVGGIAWLLDDKYGLGKNGYSITRVQQATNLSTTVHEIGHNMGAHHHKLQNYQPGPTIWENWTENTWSAGWRWTSDDNKKYCTVMTYSSGSYFEDGIDNTRVPYFSDPSINYQLQAVGDPADGNNARTIREIKHVVAAYREELPQNLPTVYTLAINDISTDGVVCGGGVISEGESGVTAKGVVWGTKKLPDLNDNYTVDGTGTGQFTSRLTGLTKDSIYYVRAYAMNKEGTVYGNQVAFIYNGGEERDFITRWQLPGGQINLEFLMYRSGTVKYTWETVPAEQSGSGNFSPGNGLVKIEYLPAGKTIRLRIAPDNMEYFYNYSSSYGTGPDREKLLDVEQWGTARWNSMKNAFYGCKNLTISAVDVPDFTNVTDMSWMFYRCSNLNGPENINKWNVSFVQNMSNLFREATSFNQNIDSWDVSSVTDIAYLFCKAKSFNQNIAGWDVSCVTDMAGIFDGTETFNQNISTWNVSGVTDMSYMFYEAKAFNQDIGNWNVSSVRDMSSMFSNTETFNRDIGSWDVSGVTDMSSMFSQANAFNSDIGNWDVSSVKDMSHMFFNAELFNQNIGKWDVSSVVNMAFMFYLSASFNQDISRWDVSSVSDMLSMFNRAGSFNQNIGGWNLSASPKMESMLSYSGMGCKNYSATLAGWSSNEKTPDNLSLGAHQINFRSDVVDSRSKLISNKGWTISGDTQGMDIGQPAANIEGENCVFKGQKDVVYTTPLIENAEYYIWDLPEGAEGASITNTIAINFTENAGSDTISVRGVNDCDESKAAILAISVEDETSESFISGETIVCQKQTTIYTVPAIENALYYDWIYTSGSDIVDYKSETNSLSLYFSPFLSSGRLSVKGFNGCADGKSSTLYVNINLLPEMAGPISGDTIVCQGEKTVTYTVPEITNAVSYEWTLPDGATGSSTTNSISVDYSANAVSGNIFVRGINSSCEGEKTVLPVTVRQAPNMPEITRSGDVLRSTAAEGNQWFDVDGAITGAVGQIFSPAKSGNYYVVTSSLGCSSKPSDIFIYFPTGVKNPYLSDVVDVFPNPVFDELILKSDHPKEIQYEIISSTGQTVRKNKFTGRTTVSTRNLASGTYLLKLENEDILEFRKIVKK